MKNKKRFMVLPFLIMVAFLVFASSCDKEDDNISEEKVPVISTKDVTATTTNTATSGGIITDDGGADVTARGVCWGTSQEPTINDSKTEDGTGLGDFTSSITGLEPNTTYYVRAYATNSIGIGYGSAISFTTLEVNLPTITTLEVSEITQRTATAGGEVTDDGGADVTARGVCWSTSQEPTINDSKTGDGTGLGNFTSSITGLEPNTTYYVRAYATNSIGTGYGSAMSFTTQEVESGTVTDSRDGNVYKWVEIGNQIWMAENLKYLPSVVGPGTGSLTTRYYYVHGYDGTEVNDAKATSNYETYGVLYNWPAVSTGNICPAGWKVPTDAEWTELTDYLGGALVAGSKLKTTSGWLNNGNGTDEYGFSALPGSGLNSEGEFWDLSGDFGYWWSATQNYSWSAWSRNMTSAGNRVARGNSRKEAGFSVRCLKNN